MSVPEFIPERTMECAKAPRKIKGRAPSAAYDLSVFDVYSSCPVLTGRHLYIAIADELRQLNRVFARLVGQEPSFVMPPLQDDMDASLMLSTIFNPTPGADHHALLSLGKARLGPFPMSRASAQKLGDSFGWVDSNIKISVEAMLKILGQDLDRAPEIATCLFRIYSLVLRANDFRLARGITFNVSMFLQERILELCFGHYHSLARRSRQERSINAARTALNFLQALSLTDLNALLQLSVFVGVIWPELSARIDREQMKAESALRELDRRVRSENLWGVDDRDAVLDHLGSSQGLLVMILDDDAESVFDLAFAQALLELNPALKITTIINRIPLSNNVSPGAVRVILENDLFKPLKASMAKGRFSVLFETQLFPSLEYQWLSNAAKSALAECVSVYLKGINLFETFQQQGLRRIYSFAVGSPTASLLTGLPEERGVVAMAEPSESAFTYHDECRIDTLLYSRQGRVQ